MASEAERILQAAGTILVVDWPNRDVPETLAKARYAVIVSGGPEPDNYSAYEFRDDEVAVRHIGYPPERVDLVYFHRPPPELPRILAVARAFRATAMWYQSGLASDGTRDPTGCWVPPDESRHMRLTVESVGLGYVDDVYIADVARRIRIDA